MKNIYPYIIIAFLILAPFATDARTSRSSHDTGMSSAMRRAIENLDEDKEKHFPIPILIGVSPSQVTDTWGQARSEGRTHEGTDIFAPRGAFVVSPTDAVVTSIVKEDKDNKNTLGGNYVYTANPGGERFYYAHLDGFADGLKVGNVLKPGDLIGYVGNTGNAAGGPTHLHFGIYKGPAINPYSRLTEEFSTKERMKALSNILDDSDHEKDLAKELLAKYRPLFNEASTEKVGLPDQIKKALDDEAKNLVTQLPSRDLSVGMQGDDVVWLQTFLINQNKGTAAQTLSKTGATGFFGEYTKNAVAEYQSSVGIVPASGMFGLASRTFLAAKK